MVKLPKNAKESVPPSLKTIISIFSSLTNSFKLLIGDHHAQEESPSYALYRVGSRSIGTRDAAELPRSAATTPSESQVMCKLS
ncbi:MAG: hypothetical protein ACFFD2_22210 [Promethearchaeota archaeon]